MLIYFKTKKLEKQLTESRKMQKRFGSLARHISQRMEDLVAADNLAVLRTIPSARCHELTQDRKGQLAVWVSNNYRIIFEPYYEEVPKKEDGGLDWLAITIIEIQEIVDYH